MKVKAKFRVDYSLLKKATVIATATLAETLQEVADQTIEGLHPGGRFKTPVLTGNMARNYKKRTYGPLVVYIFNTVFYTPFVEFGTSKRGARPHFVPAIRWANERITVVAEAKLSKRFKGL